MNESSPKGSLDTSAVDEKLTPALPSARFLLRRGALAGAVLGMLPLLGWMLIVLLASFASGASFSSFMYYNPVGEIVVATLLGLLLAALLGALVALLAVAFVLLWRKYSPHALARRSVLAAALCALVAYILIAGVRALVSIVSSAGIGALVSNPYLSIPFYFGILYSTAAGAWFGWRYLRMGHPGKGEQDSSSLKGAADELYGEGN